MIDVGKYKQILDEGLLLDHYSILCDVRDGKDLVQNKRVQGFLNLLCKKGYIEDGVLTELATKLLGEEVITKLPVKFIEPPKQQLDINYADWILKLHKDIENKLVKAKGKRQIRPSVKGRSYSFLPNPTDLGKVILRAVSHYKLKDFDKIAKTILTYVDRCIKEDSWTPLLGYYVMKDGLSPMVTDMEAVDETEEENNDLITNI